jgi:hypothetical protein
MGEPPLPTIEPVPADVPINLPFDLSWQGVLVVALVLLVIICFYLALRVPRQGGFVALERLPVSRLSAPRLSS